MPKGQHAISTQFYLHADREMDTSAVQRLGAPTRDVYVERSVTNDRHFAGFGLNTKDYCDCFLDKDHMPMDKIKVGSCCVLSPQSHIAVSLKASSMPELNRKTTGTSKTKSLVPGSRPRKLPAGQSLNLCFQVCSRQVCVPTLVDYKMYYGQVLQYMSSSQAGWLCQSRFVPLQCILHAILPYKFC